ncbi:major facilitator superfamily domain-containing protein [Stachybotrys elegans]|uniref:Major facilitator superfamily domain-containing protein n=1 Tax=Stachybotrys elegans TaxID=80388 RepID=A0A8K0WL11_9HYPO|nr:major facilitator superfamily domain-containing protein [Stachybotrys elegans]
MTNADVEKNAPREALPAAERIISNITAPIPPAPLEYNPPDGGLTAWSQVLAALLTNAMSWGYASTFGVYQLYYRESTGLPASQISWIGSVQVFLTFASCSVSGRLSDAGYLRSTLAVGGFLSVFGTFMTSLATEYWQTMLAQGICTGLGLGLAFMPAVSVASSYFKKRQAFALAVTAVGTSTGGLIFPSTVQYLIPQIGFAWAVRCAGFVAMAIVLLAIVLQKPCLPPRKSGPWVDISAFKEKPYLLFSLGAFLNLYGLYFGFFYVNAYARDVIGFSPVDSVGLLLITNALGIPARPIVGWIADHYVGPVNMYIIATVGVAATIFGWIGITTRTEMYIFSVFLGFSNGTCQGMFIGALASLTKDPQKMGTRSGMIFSLCAFATLAGPPTAGAIIDQTGGDYFWAQVWGGIVFAAGAMALSASRIAATGWTWRAKI